MEGITHYVDPLARRRYVVSETTDGCGVALHVILLPLSNEANEEVASELAMQDLREEVEVRYEGCLQDDGDIGGVEQLDRVWVGLSSDALILQMKLNSEALCQTEKLQLVQGR